MRTTRFLLDFAVEAVSHLATAMPVNALGKGAPASDRGLAGRSESERVFSPTGLLAAATRVQDVTFAMLIDDAVLA
ncbi:MAG TPA: hypothetical protein VFD39_03415 [Trueperaceae bacterium]|nr:hypothetical protein [Trueperaceae bacterium]